MSARRKLTTQEVVARLRAQEPCQINLEYHPAISVSTGEHQLVPAADIRFYSASGRVSSRPDFTLFRSEPGETYSSLLRLLAQAMDGA